jgi:signal transduction histidine kinase
MELQILTGVAAYRWAAWAWMALVLLFTRHGLIHAYTAYVLVALALLVTMAATGLLRLDHRRLGHPSITGAELAVALSLVAFDGWVFPTGHAFSQRQSLGTAWPLAAVFSVGVAHGRWFGFAAGISLGAARVVGALTNGVRSFDRTIVLSLATTTVLYSIAGWISGHVADLLRRAEREVSAARVREEVARTLHDGVLQTLALIERRSTDGELARLAREQELELRSYIAGQRPAANLRSALHEAGKRYESTFKGRVDVVVADDLEPLDEERCAAIAGAVSEALTNAGKHGGATNVTVFVEPSAQGGVFCSVRDDGSGFDPTEMREGLGITRSIRGRVEEVGGRIAIDSRAGGPTEVQMWIR